MADKPKAKISHAAAGYVNPSRKPGEFCAGCKHYIDRTTCEIVKSPINPRGWCKWYEQK